MSDAFFITMIGVITVCTLIIFSVMIYRENKKYKRLKRDFPEIVEKRLKRKKGS